MTYKTIIDQEKNGQNIVMLTRDGGEIARMSLDEWARLDATAFLIEDAVSQALHEATEPCPDPMAVVRLGAEDRAMPRGACAPSWRASSRLAYAGPSGPVAAFRAAGGLGSPEHGR